MMILFATDGSTNAAAFIPFLKWRGCSNETTLHALTVFDETSVFWAPHRLNKPKADALIGETCNSIRESCPGTVVTGATIQGNAHEAILNYAMQIKADHIAIGAHGRHGWAEPFVGSVTEQVMRKATCSTTILRSSNKVSQSKRILICADNTSLTPKLFESLPNWSWSADCEFTVLNVAEPSDSRFSENPTRDAASFIQELTQESERMRVSLQQYVDETSPKIKNNNFSIITSTELSAADEILNAAHSQQVDLIILGTHNRKNMDRLLLGSVSEAVALKASCSVEIIRPGQQ